MSTNPEPQSPTAATGTVKPTSPQAKMNESPQQPEPPRETAAIEAGQAEEKSVSKPASARSSVSQSGRVRKQVERFESIAVQQQQPQQHLVIPSGRGCMLGKIPYVEEQLQTKFKGTDDTLKGLHRLVYPGCPVSKRDVKANLRLFHGFAADQLTDDERAKLLDKLRQKWTGNGLKELCQLLGLEKSGDKGRVAERIVDFLSEPKDLGKKSQSQKKKKTASKTKKTAAKPAPKKAAPKKKKNESDEDDEDSDDVSEEESVDSMEKNGQEFQDDDSVDDQKEDEEDESSGSDDDADDSDEFNPSAKGKKKRAPKKTAAKKSPAKKKAKTTGSSPKKGKSALSKDIVESSDEDSDTDDHIAQKSDDEDIKPLAKPVAPVVSPKVKPVQPPTQSELRAYIKALLSTGNLAELTKKKIRQMCQENFVDRKSGDDWWAGQKEFINGVVDEGLKSLNP